MMVVETMMSLHEHRKIYGTLVKYAKDNSIQVIEHGMSPYYPGEAMHWWTDDESGDRIELSVYFSDDDRVYVMAHELAHLLIDGNMYKNCYVREYEANYVAARVCRHFEIDLPYYYNLDDSHVDSAIDFGMLSELADDFINRCR